MASLAFLMLAAFLSNAAAAPAQNTPATTNAALGIDVSPSAELPQTSERDQHAVNGEEDDAYYYTYDGDDTDAAAPTGLEDDYAAGGDDMDAAASMAFRPLFRYRAQQRNRRRMRAERRYRSSRNHW
ncbi:uncharacterized protein LOC126267082 [Schistocerca gregaria]|uniref:uncharacterized protein LOC126267082 n=1 Tax=Schistocerca gregaria TaxID=7010 RepID=UPI00211E583A|nr:uncharacterized protein LOC126267082 [Schistocerca gregaria]